MRAPAMVCYFCKSELYLHDGLWYAVGQHDDYPDACHERDPLLEGWRGAADRSYLPHEPYRHQG